MSLFSGKRKDDDPGAVAAGHAESAPRHAQAVRERSNLPSHREPTDKGEEMANIGKSISIKGDLTGNEDIVIEGKVEGKVDLPNGQLTIGSNGTVQGEVHAKAVVVVGRVTGNVDGSERVEIQGSGTIEGDVQAPRLVVAEGAVLNGAIQMTKKEAGATPARPPAPSEEVRKVG
jgi:cytoskeletal protein CcmA (bactofilin family)